MSGIDRAIKKAQQEKAANEEREAGEEIARQSEALFIAAANHVLGVHPNGASGVVAGLLSTLVNLTVSQMAAQAGGSIPTVRDVNERLFRGINATTQHVIDQLRKEETDGGKSGGAA